MIAAARVQPEMDPLSELDLPVIGSFAPLVGETFRAQSSHGAIALELVEAKVLPSTPGAPRQDPFSLLFRAAPDCPLEQGPVRLEHASLAALDAFLVPVLPDPDARYYEAVFN